ncbi:MAG: class I SAM-dependent methyltransferase [Promethearchaeota archaeon]|nr:MAG: class I SAM-dependent methyltransferase [Candidatus Lokiarchaeota archaeon]
MEDEIYAYECLTSFREPIIVSIMESLNIPRGSSGLDAGCGIGSIARILSDKVGEKGSVIGLDFSKDFINYARDKYSRKKYSNNNLEFQEGDINSLPFDDNAFDWVWSSDTVWAGPKELGCPSEDPIPIIKEYYRVLKPSGRVYLMYWSSQKLLPGYPVLEAALNNTPSATAPYSRKTKPMNDALNSRFWLEESGFTNIETKTYVEDIEGPLKDEDKKALYMLFQMFWEGKETERGIDEKDLTNYKNITNPDSQNYILNNKYYHGFYTYTLFKGVKR